MQSADYGWNHSNWFHGVVWVSSWNSIDTCYIVLTLNVFSHVIHKSNKERSFSCSPQQIQCGTWCLGISKNSLSIKKYFQCLWKSDSLIWTRVKFKEFFSISFKFSWIFEALQMLTSIEWSIIKWKKNLFIWWLNKISKGWYRVEKILGIVLKLIGVDA